MQERLVHYAQLAEQVGADVSLHACSAFGELVAVERQHVAVPIVRIDEVTAEAALQRGRCVGVAATLAATMVPTVRLLQARPGPGRGL